MRIIFAFFAIFCIFFLKNIVSRLICNSADLIDLHKFHAPENRPNGKPQNFHLKHFHPFSALAAVCFREGITQVSILRNRRWPWTT